MANAWNDPVWDNNGFRNNQFKPIMFSPKLPNAKYNKVRPLGFNEKGKNSTTAVVDSRSKKDNRRKEWIRKDLTWCYSLSDAAGEVFYGLLAARVHGKDNSPKTKFNRDRKGIVSRVLGDNNYQTQSLLSFVSKAFVSFTKTAQQGLMQTLAFGVLIGDRDIAARNIIVKQDGINPNRAAQIYGVDHEFGGHKANDPWVRFATLAEFLPKVFTNHTALTDIIFYNRNHWSAGSGLATVMHRIDFDLPRKIDDQINNQDVQDEFARVANKIAANDFAMCSEIRQEIMDQVTEAGSVYSQHEIHNIIMPKVDQAINSLKENVTVAQEIYEEHNPGIVDRMLNKMGMK